jgi:hypothetical protein
MQMNVKMMIAAGATIFVSIVAVAVFSRVSAPVEAVVPTAVVTEVVVADVVPTARIVVDAATVAQREADYQARLAEANRVIAQAAAELQQSRSNEQALIGQYNAVVSNVAASVAPVDPVVPVAPVVVADPVAAAPVAQVSLDVAQGIAQSLAPSAVLLRTPELVMYENAMAYEFVFDKGTVYVAAGDGALVYNGIAVMQAAQQAAASQPSSNHESDDNHESESDDNQEQGEHDD